jgi:hypothetical protein
MKKIVSIFILLASILAASTIFADDDDDNKNNDCVKFIYQKSDIGKGAVESGNYYTGPSGKIYLFPYWAKPPVPTPTPDPIPDPTPDPVPTPAPSSDNAFNSCIQCHKSSDAKYKFDRWVTTLHQKSGHKSKSCATCHNLLK